jgi:hypothetical protein
VLFFCEPTAPTNGICCLEKAEAEQSKVDLVLQILQSCVECAQFWLNEPFDIHLNMVGQIHFINPNILADFDVIKFIDLS